MTLQERYEDIEQRSGLSEAIVRRVIAAQAESIAVSLAKGEKATVPQICQVEPVVRHKMKIENSELTEASYFRLKVKPLVSLQERVSKLEETVKEDSKITEEDADIRVGQIGALM